jgi:two-component system response regulator YesN
MMPIGERQQYVLVRVAPSPESRKPFQELLDEIISKISSFEFHAELSQACAPSSMEVVLLLAFPAAQAAVRARISTELNMLKSSLSKLFRLGELACSFEITNVLTQLPACYDRLVKGYCDTSLDDGANRAGLGQHAFLVSKIKQLISEKYAEPSLTVSMIAERMRYTPAYICMVFRRQTGMTPGDYISQVRHVHAKRLLQDVTLKICDVAALSGYESENYFSKVFKKHESVSPSEYRKDRCNDER